MLSFNYSIYLRSPITSECNDLLSVGLLPTFVWPALTPLLKNLIPPVYPLLFISVVLDST